MEATPASVHDSCVDLSEPREAVYQDKGYFGAEPRGWDATMMRGVRGHQLSECDRLRNLRVGLKPRPVERIFAVVKWAFRGRRILVTFLPRVRVKMVFTCLFFNLIQMGSLSVGS
jgi:IS5 family transposase